MRYDALFAALGPALQRSSDEGGDAALWGRFMTLGPSPEFCLHASVPLALPASIAAKEVRLERPGAS